ncbi:MAG: hypothetical protein ASARMPREDX12_004355 [Alectoria sarmentosa]|nr:MAG: hypothetical protein ASARMPREDX12_004355 [Alectoria sarmentosa]
MTAPSFSSPAYDNESNAWKLMTTDLVTVIIAFVLVLGRMYKKCFITKYPGWEDCCSVLALLIAIARVVGDFLGMHISIRYGETYQHSPRVLFESFGHRSNSAPSQATPPDRHPQLVTVDGLLYVVSITIAKFAILIFLYRIFKVSSKFRYTSWAVGAIMAVWALITVLLVCFSCKPLAASFNYKLRFAPTTVRKPESYDVENIFGFCNIFVDFMLLLMPMPLLWMLHMTRAKKVGVSVIFANGAVIAAIAIVRQYILYTSPDAADPSWDIVQIKIWMTIEVNLAIICGCLPVLQPLFRKLPLLPPFLPSHLRSRFTGGHSAMEQSSWPQKLSGPRHAGGPDLENVQKAAWREPDEMSMSGSSAQSISHQQRQQYPMVQSALEPARVRNDGSGYEGSLRGLAL